MSDPQHLGLTAIVLAGGLGSRLRPVVADRPKPLALVAERPFLGYVLEQLARAGVRRCILCTGHLAAQVEAQWGDSAFGMSIHHSVEHEPLGTAGALAQATRLLSEGPALVLNGDSYCDADLRELVAKHRSRAAQATMLVVHRDDVSRFGTVGIDASDRVVAFEEKRGVSTPGWINAGVYVIEKTLLDAIPDLRPLSLERDLFPSWSASRFFVHRCWGKFIDIGTPDDYDRAQGFFEAAPRGGLP